MPSTFCCSVKSFLPLPLESTEQSTYKEKHKKSNCCNFFCRFEGSVNNIYVYHLFCGMMFFYEPEYLNFYS